MLEELVPVSSAGPSSDGADSRFRIPVARPRIRPLLVDRSTKRQTDLWLPPYTEVACGEQYTDGRAERGPASVQSDIRLSVGRAGIDLRSSMLQPV
jgi:hypothetical protein